MLGLAIGAAVGAGGAYLALEKPWSSPPAQAGSAQPDAGPGDEVADTDRGTRGKRGKRGKRNRARADGEAALQEIDERVQLTAADRTMVWRGPVIAAPDSAVDFGGEGGGRRLSDDEINTGVRSGQSAMVGCIAEARGQAELAAKIILKMLVSDRGSVSKLRVQAPGYLLKNGLYECASRATGKMRFPATGAATLVTVPFDLSY